jgi:hypothetical protein
MPTAPQHPPAKPPSPPNQPPAHEAKAHEPMTIGAKPNDPHDPQAVKFEPHAAPPHWTEPKPVKEQPVFTPKPALDPRAEKPPAGVYADGMGIADEQRARSAWIEAHGMKAYHEAVDERTEEEKAPKQVQGVVPPTKRE